MSKELKPVIYVAGRFSDGGKLSDEECYTNRGNMRKWSLEFMKAGWAVICPIENDEWAVKGWKGEEAYLDILASDCAILERCDAIFMCPGWEAGRGAVIEFDFANDNDIPVFQKTVIAAKTWLDQQASVVDMWRDI